MGGVWYRLNVAFRELSNTWKLLGLGDSSRKFHFFDSFRTPIAPKPEFSNTWKLLGLDGPCQPHG